MKLLHIDSSILGNHSVSRELTAAIVDKLKKANPYTEVIYRDLAVTPPPHMTLRFPVIIRHRCTRDHSTRLDNTFVLRASGY